MSRELLLERFFTACISGDRAGARAVVDEVLEADCSADMILCRLLWPVLEKVQTLHRADQLSEVSHHYATRLMRSIGEQLQLRLEQQPRNGKRVLVTSGAEEMEEFGAQISADMLEAAGYEVLFAGGGIANDELVAQVGEKQVDILVVFGAIAATVPQTRVLIDTCHEIGLSPTLQIAVGGGVFNRADGLAEEIGSDLWAKDPEELVQTIQENPEIRMTPTQRTVGRRRRGSKIIRTEAA